MKKVSISIDKVNKTFFCDCDARVALTLLNEAENSLGIQGDTPMMGAGAGAAVGAAAVSGAAKVEISARMLKKAPARNARHQT